MEPDPSFTFSSTDVQSLADLLADLVLGEKSVDDDLRPKQEFMCPFCGEIHDADALSYHIHDQHPRHLTNGDCPICEDSFGMELVGHIAKEHGDLLKVQRKRRYRTGGPNPTSRQELDEEIRKHLLRDFSCIAPSELDPLLSSFISTRVLADEQCSAQVQPSPLEAIEMQSLEDDFLEREPEPLQPLDNHLAEKDPRFEFVQRLLMSAILDNNLPMKL
ncbi:protein DEHYDRATION-INDUCED 19-like [Arachis ipaensis]|uniref:protein DEHYDRATION-INDUCED 19-like n=1 Tax=Arachis ipaensis TaxID=130454 RepID=UPI000A2AF4E8|nr:protein DEHYDRATION-INDUCED 19-like [Arachis ipaensis]XP_025630158.1 protein DEHYDRATION-INDUCED 19 [Arachis hypogaea]